MDNAPEAPAAPASEAPTTNTNPAPAEPAAPAAPAAPTADIPADQIEAFNKFVNANGGFEKAFAKLRNDVSNPAPQQPAQPQQPEQPQQPVVPVCLLSLSMRISQIRSEAAQFSARWRSSVLSLCRTA